MRSPYTSGSITTALDGLVLAAKCFRIMFSAHRYSPPIVVRSSLVNRIARTPFAVRLAAQEQTIAQQRAKSSGPLRCYDYAMRQGRRRFFIGSGFAWLLSRVTPSRSAGQRSAALEEATLRAFVDLLIPADEITPSASALGVDKQLLTVANGKPAYQRLLELGLDWLNTQSRADFGGNFPELDEGKRETIVRQAAAAAYNSLPRVFFERTRADAFSFYYSRPESWRGIAYYRGPPQPLGFMDYARAPRKQR